ncbi:hypothetical protein L226DRAFT_574589 [Lentinus tigrinus ALCF2SS1-7]|uniref:Uncharacterized protein n=1 Tax=Lentinus tigrinus ALCF2SS1-6 TaxID=1328759 RepID=A0A5C2RX65_9APHY|nr:hypothetical protein L227DRAFT_656883 [Lentinus tigrinus ALCF2SS1-6]RPD70698.1 hypothetical protein L226DRAFT_574589 [Lentinus tigrinus ALCF2SS1-7]
MTLTLEFPAAPLLPPDRQANQPPYYTLTALNSYGLQDKYTVIQVHECISSKNDGMRQVFRITMESEGMKKTRNFVCKVAFGRRWFQVLKEEALLYEGKLEALCGKAVPVYYGFFVGETYKGRTGIMVLEDCGRPLRVSLRRQPLYFRRSVLDALIDVHRAEVDLEDFTEDNVVATHHTESNTYIPVIINFSNANARHKCRFTGEFKTYSPMPCPSEIDCSELWRVFIEAEILLPRYVTFFSREVPVEYATSVELLKANGHPPEHTPQFKIDSVAYEVVKKHYDWCREREALDKGKVQLDTRLSDVTAFLELCIQPISKIMAQCAILPSAVRARLNPAADATLMAERIVRYLFDYLSSFVGGTPSELSPDTLHAKPVVA